jgi:hypothetical protein
MATADLQGGPDFYFKFLKKKSRAEVVTALPDRYDEVEESEVAYEASSVSQSTPY